MNWPTVKLGEVIEEAKPGFASGSKEESGSGIAQVRMNNVTRDGALVWNDVRRVPTPKNVDKLLLTTGDVLFNSTNSPNLVGKSALFSGFGEPLTFSNHFLRLRPRSDVLDGSFLARCLVDEFQRGTFEGLCKRWVNQAAVSREDLFALEIPLPPLSEQKRLAAILDCADATRRLRRESLARLDELAQSLFIELFGDPATNPKSWALVQLTEVCNPKQWPTLAVSELSGKGFPVYGANGLIGYHDIYNHEISTVLITCRGATCGTINVCPPKSYVTGNAMALDDPQEDKITPSFLEWFLRLKGLNSVISGSAQPQITRQGLSSVKIPLPPLALQQKFAEQIAELEAIKVRARTSLLELDALFASLQARAFAGELSSAA